MSIEQLRLEVLKLVYRHDRPAGDAVIVADELVKFVTDWKEAPPQPDEGGKDSDKAVSAPKRRKAASQT